MLVRRRATHNARTILCRRHHRRRMTAATARVAALSPDVLPVSSL